MEIAEGSQPRSPSENERLLHEIHGVVEDILCRLEQHDLKMQVVIEWCEQLAQLLHAPQPTQLRARAQTYLFSCLRTMKQRQKELHDS